MGIPISDIPLNPKIKPDDAESQRKRLVIKHIMDREGLDYRAHFLGREYNSKSDYPKQFEEFVDNYKKYGKPKTKEERDIREKELDILYKTDYNGFCKLLGYKLPECKYPFSDYYFHDSRKKVAIKEILCNEGYVTPIDDVSIKSKWRDDKRRMDRAYELYTMKHSDFEKLYGSKLTEEMLKNRDDIVEIIMLRENIRFDDPYPIISSLCPIGDNWLAHKKQALIDAYELLKD